MTVVHSKILEERRALLEQMTELRMLRRDRNFAEWIELLQSQNVYFARKINQLELRIKKLESACISISTD